MDLRFVDLPGIWQHFSLPAKDLSDDLFEEGIGFDGSSIRGFQQIQESDMLLIADPETAYIDPVLEIPTLSLICNVFDPVTREAYTRDPRHIAQKAEAYLKSTGIADISYWGPEAEFYIFDDVRFDQNAPVRLLLHRLVEGAWNTGREEGPNLGYKLRHKEGYFPVPPADQLQDLRIEIILKLDEVGVPVEVHHHEVGTAGQGEIDMRFGTADQDGATASCTTSTSSRTSPGSTASPPPSCPSRSSATTARACTATRASGRGRPTCSGTRRATARSARPPSTTSAAC